MNQFFVFLPLLCACLGHANYTSPPSSLSHLQPLPSTPPPLPLKPSSSPTQPDKLQTPILPQIDGSLPPLPLPTAPSRLPPRPPPKPTLPNDEDKQTINKTLEKYGFPRDFTILELPGPELLVDYMKYQLPDKLPQGESRIYTLRIRTITDTFSYNGRYEESKLKEVDGKQILVIKGQFGEHFKRESGGYYIRTVGYTLDENGYQQFLIDLTKAETMKKTEPPPVLVISGGVISPGAPTDTRKPISSTVLGSLIGGNSLG